MIPVPSGVRVYLSTGATDMRKGMPGLSLLVQEALGRDPYAGDLHVFRGRRGDSSRFSGMMGWACRFMPSVWTGGVSSGRRRSMA